MEILSLSSYVYNPHAIPPLVTGLAILLLGIFVLSKNIKDLKHIVFFLFTLSISIWQVSQFAYNLAANEKIAYFWVSYLLFLGISFIHVLPYHFSVLMLNLRWQRRFVIIGYILGAATYFSQILGGGIVSGQTKVYWGYIGVLGPLAIPYLAFFYVYAAALISNCFFGYKRAATDAERLKLKYLTIGLLIGTLGSIDFLGMSGFEVYQFGYIFVDLLAVIMAYTIVRHRLLDIETVVHRTLLWLTTSFFIVASIFFLVGVLRKWVETLTNLQQTILYTAIFYILLSAYNWLRPKIDHFLQRRRYSDEAIFIRFIKDVAQIKGIDELADRIIKTLSNVFYANKISVFIFDEDYKRCLLAKCSGGGIDGIKNYFPEIRLLEWLKRYDDVIEIEQLEMDPKYSDIRDAAKGYFEGMEARIAIPIIFYERLLGLIVIGKKGNLKPFTTADIKLLSMFRLDVAVVLSNSMSYSNLQRLKGELENKVRARTEELAKAYIELKKDHEKAKEVAQLKSLFIANVSHELRTPLSSIIGYAELLHTMEFGALNDKQEKYINTILKNGRHLLHLINDILDLSHIETDKMMIISNNFTISNLLTEAVEEILPIVSRKEIKLKTDIEDGLPPISADYTRLRQAVDNLLCNAIKFTPMGGSIKVTAKHASPSSLPNNYSENGKKIHSKDNLKYIYVSIEDSGIGIRKEDHERIFDVFEQVDNSYTKEYQGSGLGLAIVKKNIELHNGRIWVESELGRGSRFNFIIPERVIADIALKKTSFDLYKMLHGIIFMLSSEMEAKKVKIDFKSEWTFKYKITADKELLRGILINVINNAVRYSPEGGNVVVDLKSTAERYSISVRNNWNGDVQITPLFFHNEKNNKKNAKTYIGILDAKMIINAHNGSITIKNDEEEKATIVEISIPVQA